LADIYNCYNNSSSNNGSNSPNASPQPKATCPVALLANKNDLEHLRTVDKIEGITASLQYGCQFYELSVAENSPEVYQSFQTIINTLIGQHQLMSQPSKRKFSVSKMLGNLRLGRTSPNSQQIITSQASIVDTNIITHSPSKSLSNCNSFNSAADSPLKISNGKSHQRHSSSQSDSSSSNCSSSSSNSGSCSNLSNSICHLKSKLVELHSMKKRHNSPPICSL